MFDFNKRIQFSYKNKNQNSTIKIKYDRTVFEFLDGVINFLSLVLWILIGLYIFASLSVFLLVSVYFLGAILTGIMFSGIFYTLMTSEKAIMEVRGTELGEERAEYLLATRRMQERYGNFVVFLSYLSICVFYGTIWPLKPFYHLLSRLF